MTAAPTWTILVPTLGERHALFERLMDRLLPQVAQHDGRVQVHGWFNNGRPGLPEIRHRMMEQVTTDYVSFFDDDDLPAPDLADEVMAALASRPDYVGWQVQCYSDGMPTAIAYHSLDNRGWTNLADRYLRDISHINPMRTEIARSADFRKTAVGAPEDRAWAQQLRRGKRLRSEVMINRIMYHYLYSTSRTVGIGSRWKQPSKIHKGVAERSEIKSPYFTWSN